MDDFDLAAPIDGDTSSKEQIKKILIVSIAIFLSIFVIFTLIFVIKRGNSNLSSYDSKSIPVIKAKSNEIKIVVNNKGNEKKSLDVDIYNLLENKDRTKEKEIIINDSGLNEVKIPNYNKDVDEEKEQFSLEKKIEEISNEDVDDIILEGKNDSEKTIQPVKKETVKKSTVVANNTQIKKNNVKPIDYEKLKKEIKNNSLINNIKAKKDVKPTKRVQLAALASEEMAEKYWDTLIAKYSSLFKNKNRYIETVNLGKKGIFYRLQVGTFNTKEEAIKFCEDYIKLKRGEKTDCILINID